MLAFPLWISKRVMSFIASASKAQAADLAAAMVPYWLAWNLRMLPSTFTEYLGNVQLE